MMKITKKSRMFYKDMKFKNIKEYLQCYLKSDITSFS